MGAGDHELPRPQSRLGQEAQELADRAWARARSQELTEEDRQDTVAQLQRLAEQEPDEGERRGIEAEIHLLDDIFEDVAGEEATAVLRDSPLVAEAREIFARAPLEPSPGESAEDRQARLQQVDDALTAISQVYDRADYREQHHIQGYVDQLWAVLDPGRGPV